MTKAEMDEIVGRPWSIDFEYGEAPDEGVLAFIVEWPDCFAAGRTRAEALTALEKALRELASYRLAEGMDIPDPAASFSGKLNLRLSKQIHREAAHRAMQEGASLNTWITAAIARMLGPLTEERRAGGRGATHPRIPAFTARAREARRSASRR